MIPRFIVTDIIEKPCPWANQHARTAQFDCGHCNGSGLVLPEFVIGGASQLLIPCPCESAVCRNHSAVMSCCNCHDGTLPVSAGSTLTDIPLWTIRGADDDRFTGHPVPLGVVAGTVWAIDKRRPHIAVPTADVRDAVQAVPEDVVVIATRLERTTT